MQRKRKQPPIKFTIRFYPGPDDDLIQWLDELEARLSGVKGQTIKETLRQGLGCGPGQAAPGAPNLDLAQVRRVVEASVTSALSQWDGRGLAGTRAALPEEKDDEVEDLLAALQKSLVLGDDG